MGSVSRLRGWAPGVQEATSSFATGSSALLGRSLPLCLGFPVAEEHTNGIAEAIRVQNPASSSTATHRASIPLQPLRL